MITTVIRMALIAGLAIGTVFVPQVVIAQSSTAVVQTVPAAISDAVAFVDIVDVSQSLSKAINSMSAAEVKQLTTSLKPDDVYARINFDGAARLALLMPVREVADVERITSVLSQNVAANGAYTSVAAGLSKARDVIEKERGRRTAVVVLITDGELSMPGGVADERKQLDVIAAWWKAQPWARRIVVGARPDKADQAKAIAKLLGADYVTLEDYATKSVVARAISGARATKPTTASAEQTAPAPSQWRFSLAWLWLIPVTSAVIWYFRGTSSAGRDDQRSDLTMIPAAPGKPEMQVTVRVTAAGRMQETVLPLNELEGGVFTLGAGGNVPVPGLPGRPVTIDTAGDALSIAVEPGAGIKVDGEDADALPQPLAVAGSCRLSYRGAAIAIRLHARNAGANVAAPLVLRRIG